MPIVRLIFVHTKPELAGEVERVWRGDCAPLMVKQPCCLSGKLLQCLDAPGDYISYAEWDSMENIERYLAGSAHQEIVDHSRKLRTEKPVVRNYRLV